MSPKVGLLFRTTEWLTIWGSYAEAFLAPGPHRGVRRGLAFPRHPGRLPGQLLRPQSGLAARDHRAGLRTRFDDLLIEGDRLRLEAAYFISTSTTSSISRWTSSRGRLAQQSPESRAPRFRDRAPLFGDAEQGCKGEHSSVPPGQARGDARPTSTRVVFTGRGRFVKRRDQVPAGVAVTPGYGVCDLYASWLPAGASYSGLRVDFGIENLADKSYRRPSRSSMRAAEFQALGFLQVPNGEVIPDVRIVRVSFGIDQRS